MDSKGASAGDWESWDPGEQDDASRRGPTQPLAWARAIGRHWVVAGGTFALCMAATLVVIRILPRTYHVQAELIARRQQVLPTVARPSLGEDSPTSTAHDLVHRRETLAAIVDEAKVLESLRAKDSSSRPQTLSDGELSNLLVRRLDAALTVVPGDGTVTIAIDWPDPDVAFRIVGAAVRNYLDARRLAETQPIEEAIRNLETRATQLRGNVESLMVEVQKYRAARPRARSQVAATEPSAAEEQMAQLEMSIKAKRETLRDAEEYHRRRLTELRGKLLQEESLYGPGYPSQISLKQEIEALSQPSPQISALRDELRAAEAEFRRRFGKAPGRSESSDTVGGANFSWEREAPPDSPDARFKHATLEYQGMMDRISGARLELETARAAFKYRYSVIWPAELPKKPDRPKVPSLLAAGAGVGLLLSLCMALAADAVSGRIVERSQIEQGLGIPILGEFRSR